MEELRGAINKNLLASTNLLFSKDEVMKIVDLSIDQSLKNRVRGTAAPTVAREGRMKRADRASRKKGKRTRSRRA